MPISRLGPSGDDSGGSWGRRAQVHRPAALPDADPHSAYRPAAVGTRRTARWFILVGVALVILMLPVAVPENSQGSSTPYSSSRGMNHAAAGSLLAWDAARLDLTGLDNRCSPVGEAIMPGVLEATCSSSGGGGDVDLDITSMAGVDDPVIAAERSLRAVLVSDIAAGIPGADFAPTDTDGLLHPSLADGDLLMTPVITLREGAGDSYFESPPDPYERFDRPEISPVQYQHGGGGLFAVAVSFTMAGAGADDVLYTAVVSGDNEMTVEQSATSLLGDFRAA